MTHGPRVGLCLERRRLEVPRPRLRAVVEAVGVGDAVVGYHRGGVENRADRDCPKSSNPTYKLTNPTLYMSLSWTPGPETAVLSSYVQKRHTKPS